jgi:hypothetical protein
MRVRDPVREGERLRELALQAVEHARLFWRGGIANR